MKVMLAGASGLVGGHTLESLLEDNSVTDIILLVRTQLLLSHAKVFQIVTNFDELDSLSLKEYGIEGVDAALCALGSTIKKSGSQKAFHEIDCSYVLSFADFAKKNGATKFAVISALGADKGSSIFYNRVKGEMEEGLKALGFETLTIIRPSLLLGQRKESRPAERIFIHLSPLINKTLIGPLKKYRGIEAKKVASYLARSIHWQEKGQIIVENDQMLSI